MTTDVLATLSQDWLGLESAIANAWAQSIPYAGGQVQIPCGTYWVNFDLMDPSGQTNALGSAGYVDIGGCSKNGVYINITAPSLAALYGHALFPTPTWEDALYIHDMSSFGAGGGSIGTFPTTSGIGMVLGNFSYVHDLEFRNYRSSYGIIGDHVDMDRVTSPGSAYGLELLDFTPTYGNFEIKDSNFSNVTLAGIAVAPANDLNASILTNVSIGFGPYGFYKEPTDTNMTNPTGFMTGNVLNFIPLEQCGNEAIKDASGGGTGGVLGNQIISGGNWACGQSPSQALPSPGTGMSPPGSNYLIDAPGFADNIMIGTTWNGYATVSVTGAGYISTTNFTATTGTFAIGETITGVTAAGVRIAPNTVITGGTSPNWTVNNSQTWAASGSPGTAYGLAANSGTTQAIVNGGGANTWLYDPGPTSAGAATPFYLCAGVVSNCSNVSSGSGANTFTNNLGSGYFVQVQSNVPNGIDLFSLGIAGFYTAGYGPFAGIAASPCFNGITTVYLCPMYTQGLGIFALQNSASDSLSVNQPIYASNLGVSLSGNPQSAIGWVSYDTFTNAGGQVGVQVKLNPVTPGIYNVGTTGSIGGSALAAGACATGTVTIAGVTTGMTLNTTPVTYPGAGFDWQRSYVSGTNTVTVQVCNNKTTSATPTASAYNVRIQQ